MSNILYQIETLLNIKAPLRYIRRYTDTGDLYRSCDGQYIIIYSGWSWLRIEIYDNMNEDPVQVFRAKVKILEWEELKEVR